MNVTKIVVSLFLTLTSIWAEKWSQTSALYHFGNTFSTVAGSDTLTDGIMTTLTLEHAGAWEYGSNFFFIDMTSGSFVSGKKYKVYSEWAPALSMSKIFNTDVSFSFVKDFLLSGELNNGDDFQAMNLGLRAALDIPGFNFFDINFFVRDDNYNQPSYQITFAWNSTFSIAHVPLIFEGFFDHYGVDFGSETLSQPRLLIDGMLYGVEHLHVGMELYFYRSSKAPWRSSVFQAVPQFALKWTW